MNNDNPPLDPTRKTASDLSLGDPARGPSASAETGSFTTTLAATAKSQMGITIPAAFLAAGTPGTVLRLVPIEQPRGKDPIELYFKTGPAFSLGRSPEVDWVTLFYPRSERNDQRSKRLSKVHARIEFRDSQLWLLQTGSGTVQVNGREVDPASSGAKLRERDQVALANDYLLEVYYDISLQGTVDFSNGNYWQMGRIEFSPTLLGAVRFEPVNSALGFRNSCWLFVDVGFGAARGGVLTAGAELAPQQGVILFVGGCFWILNLVNNGKVTVNDYQVAAQEVVPLTRGDSIWLGGIRYRAEIN